MESTAQQNKVKMCWQNEAGMFEVSSWGETKPSKVLSEQDLNTLMDMMTGYNFIIISWPGFKTNNQ